MRVHLNEKQAEKLCEYLDKDYGKAAYDFIKNGDEYHDAQGNPRMSSKLLPLFCAFLNNRARDEFNEFKAAYKKMPEVKKVINVSYSTIKERFIASFNKKASDDDLKAAWGAIYSSNDLVQLVNEYQMWLMNINGTAPKAIAKSICNGNISSQAVMSQAEVHKTGWMIHLARYAEDAYNIAKYGFKNGISTKVMDKIAYTGFIKDEDRDGKLIYAYSVQDILDGAFNWVSKPGLTYDKGFDCVAWEYAPEGGVMFKAPGVSFYHMGDKQYQVLANADMAKDFVVIQRSIHVPLKDQRDTRNSKAVGNVWYVMTKEKEPIYYNSSLTKVIEWVTRNYDQYRKHISQDHDAVSKKLQDISGYTYDEISSWIGDIIKDEEERKEMLDDFKKMFRGEKNIWLTSKEEALLNTIDFRLEYMRKHRRNKYGEYIPVNESIGYGFSFGTLRSIRSFAGKVRYCKERLGPQ